MEYKKLAFQKYIENKQGITDDTNNLEDYLAFCYLKYKPNEYGKKIQKRLEEYFGMYKVCEKKDKGDSLYSTTNNNKIWFEIKVSYLGKNDTYSVRYIRPWQTFDYYLLCFIDPKNCEPKFYVLTCEDILNNFNCHYMNGTKESNESNKKSALGLSIKIGTPTYRLFCSLNKMKGNESIHVFEFLASQNLKKN